MHMGLNQDQVLRPFCIFPALSNMYRFSFASFQVILWLWWSQLAFSSDWRRKYCLRPGVLFDSQTHFCSNHQLLGPSFFLWTNQYLQSKRLATVPRGWLGYLPGISSLLSIIRSRGMGWVSSECLSHTAIYFLGPSCCFFQGTHSTPNFRNCSSANTT